MQVEASCWQRSRRPVLLSVATPTQRCTLLKRRDWWPKRDQGRRWSFSNSRPMVVANAAASSSAKEAPPSSSSADGGRGSSGVTAPYKTSSPRAIRLEIMVQLRKLYRNLLRAEALLQAPSPVYQPPQLPESEPGAEQSPAEAARQADEEAARLSEAVETVAEMELTAEQLKIGIRALKCSPTSYGSVLQQGNPKDGGSSAKVEALVEERVAQSYSELVARAAQEVEFLPFPSEDAAYAALDARNARYRGHVSWFPDPSGDTAEGSQEGMQEKVRERGPGIGERLGKAERVAEEFVVKKLSEVKKVAGTTSPQGVLRGLRSGATAARDLWVRLNGGRVQGSVPALPDGLPELRSTEAERAQHVTDLNLSIDGLEKKLQDASKARETKLRKAGIQGRAKVAGELREMDDTVAGLSKELAVRTLQLEMEFVCGGLEEEALDVVGDSKAGPRQALGRRGSSDELTLLVAEFAGLDEQLYALTALVDANEALLISDEELARLAADIPDMRARLGINDTQVFGGAGLGWVRVQLQFKEGVAKVVEGVNFGSRGVRLPRPGGGGGGRLFWRALMGSTLKPREVQALRRTLKDLLTFIPFAIILIAPLTPVGHVLIFGFIQRYFPNLFPSQFSTKRQELMVKYEDLKQQLAEAQKQAEIEIDEMEFQRAAEALTARTRAVTRSPRGSASSPAPSAQQLTPSVAVGGAGSGSSPAPVAAAESDSDIEGPAARAVRDLEKRLAAAADDSYTSDSG